MESFEISSKDVRIDREKELGRGSFGVVYQGFFFKEAVAVKQLLSNLSDKADVDFRREAQVMSRLRYKYIVQLRGICIDQRPYMMILEFMPGGSLSALLQVKNRPPRQRLRLL